MMVVLFVLEELADAGCEVNQLIPDGARLEPIVGASIVRREGDQRPT